MAENRRHLLTLTCGQTGKSQLTRLPPGRWWQALGCTNHGAGGYDLWVQWGDVSILVESLNGAMSSKAYVAFPDAFIYVVGGASESVLIAVSE